MDLSGRSFVLRYQGTTAPPVVVLGVQLRSELGEFAELEDLPAEIEQVGRPGARRGFVQIQALGWQGLSLPPLSLPAASLVDTPESLRISYLPGLRGPAGEIGAILRPMTAEAWDTLRAKLRHLPELKDLEAIERWIHDPAA